MTKAVTREELEAFLIDVLKNRKEFDISGLNLDSTLKDFNIDSFGFLEIIFSIEQQYNIHFPNELDHLVTAKDVIDETFKLINEEKKTF